MIVRTAKELNVGYKAHCIHNMLQTTSYRHDQEGPTPRSSEKMLNNTSP